MDLKSLTVDKLYQILPQECTAELLRPRYAYFYDEIMESPLFPTYGKIVQYINEETMILPLEDVMAELYDYADVPLVESEKYIRKRLLKMRTWRIRRVPIFGRFSDILYVVMAATDGIPIITDSEEVLTAYLEDIENMPSLEKKVICFTFNTVTLTREQFFP